MIFKIQNKIYEVKLSKNFIDPILIYDVTKQGRPDKN